MITFKTGVHTIEFKTANYLKLDNLPPKYEGAVRPEGKKSKHYIFTLPKVYGVPEYSTPAETQRDIDEAFIAFINMGAGLPKVTRIDYRLDDHRGRYGDHVRLMTIIVNLIAHRSGIYDRRVSYLDENEIKTSVRCMPGDKDHITGYGVEYYDKFKERGNSEQGNARLELRRLNMTGESVPFIVKEWRDMLQSITRKEYLAMLEDHARSLHSTRQDGETAAKFISRMRDRLIAYEEWGIVHKITGRHSNHYERVTGLPKWADVKRFIDDLTAQLDEALAQQGTRTRHPDSVLEAEPF